MRRDRDRFVSRTTSAAQTDGESTMSRLIELGIATETATATNARSPIAPPDPPHFWVTPSGTRFALRPIHSRDQAPLGEMYRRLSRQSHYERFHGATRGPTPEALRRMAEVDHVRHVALVVTMPVGEGERIVADARYVVGADDPHAAEFALVVDDAWQQQGIGDRALHGLVAAARRHGLEALHGGVLASNAAMLAFLRRRDFACMRDPDDARVVRARAAIAEPFRGAA